MQALLLELQLQPCQDRVFSIFCLIPYSEYQGFRKLFIWAGLRFTLTRARRANVADRLKTSFAYTYSRVASSVFHARIRKSYHALQYKIAQQIYLEVVRRLHKSTRQRYFLFCPIYRFRNTKNTNLVITKNTKQIF